MQEGLHNRHRFDAKHHPMNDSSSSVIDREMEEAFQFKFPEDSQCAQNTDKLLAYSGTTIQQIIDTLKDEQPTIQKERDDEQRWNKRKKAKAVKHALSTKAKQAKLSSQLSTKTDTVVAELSEEELSDGGSSYVAKRIRVTFGGEEEEEEEEEEESKSQNEGELYAHNNDGK